MGGVFIENSPSLTYNEPRERDKYFFDSEKFSELIFALRIFYNGTTQRVLDNGCPFCRIIARGYGLLDSGQYVEY